MFLNYDLTFFIDCYCYNLARSERKMLNVINSVYTTATDKCPQLYNKSVMVNTKWRIVIFVSIGSGVPEAIRVFSV